jgi:hypothetical protein
MGVMKVCFGSWRETFGRLKIDEWKIERESGVWELVVSDLKFLLNLKAFHSA